MGFRRILLTTFSILLIYSGTAFSAPTDATIADDVTTEESHTQNIDIEVYDDEQPVAVAIVDPNTLNVVDSAILYGGTGSPNSTEKPYPFSIYDNLPNDTIVVHLVKNGTSDSIATETFGPIADKLRKNGPKAIEIYSDNYYGQLIIVRVINKLRDRSIIIELTDINGAVLSPTAYLFKSNGTEIPIVLPLICKDLVVPILVQDYDANTGQLEGQVAFFPDYDDDDDDDDEEEEEEEKEDGVDENGNDVDGADKDGHKGVDEES